MGSFRLPSDFKDPHIRSKERSRIRVSTAKLLMVSSLMLTMLALFALYRQTEPTAEMSIVNKKHPGAQHTSGVSGTLFQGSQIRTFTGSRVFSGDTEPITSKFRHSGRGHSNVASSQFEPMPSMAHFRKWAICTTIFKPSPAILGAAALQGWALVVVGDRGAAEFNLTAPNVVVLDDKDQEALAAHFPTLLDLLPWKHFGRKNIGYLFAIAHGAEVIWDFDDDNILKPGKEPAVPTANVYKVQPIDHQHCEAYNMYPYMGDVSYNSDGRTPPSWPRGFPLELIQKPCNHTLMPTAVDDVAVVQSLADNDPDVDGIYRLTRGVPFTFNPSSQRTLVIPAGTLTPWNAQATLILQPAFWSLLLPTTVHGRVSDIYRSYISQRLLWDVGFKVAFSPPMVDQYRSAHNYLADMQAENDLYHKSGQLVKFLREWQGTSPTIAGRMEELAVQLFERGYIELQDVHLTQQWLLSLEAAGYEFPPIISTANIIDTSSNVSGPFPAAAGSSRVPRELPNVANPLVEQALDLRKQPLGVDASKVAIAAQGRASQLQVWIDMLPGDKADLFYLAYDQPCPSIQPRHSHQVKCIFMPQSTWTTGRNQLAVEVYREEANTSNTYKYWSFFDADYADHLRCTWCMSSNTTVDSSKCCMEKFMSLLLQAKIQYAIVAPSCLISGDESCFHSPDEVFDNPCLDARANAFHRAAVPLFIPYLTNLDGRSWWMSQQLLFYFAKHCLPHMSSVQISGFASRNSQSDPYPRGLLPSEEIAAVLGATAPRLYNDLFLSKSPNHQLPVLPQGCGEPGARQNVSIVVRELSGAWMRSAEYSMCLKEQSARFQQLTTNGLQRS